jgi:hypothetical protein
MSLAIRNFGWRDDGNGFFGPRRGWDATVDIEGDVLHFSRLQGEADWYCDAYFKANGYPVFCEGFGSRVTRKQIASDELAEQLDIRMRAAKGELLVSDPEIVEEAQS